LSVPKVDGSGYVDPPTNFAVGTEPHSVVVEDFNRHGDTGSGGRERDQQPGDTT